MAGGSASSSTPQTVAQNPGQAVQSMNAATVAEMPAYYQQLEALMPGYTTAASNAANQALGSTVGNASNLYQQYAPTLNQVSQQLGASNLQSNAQAIGNTLNSPNAQSVNQGFAGGQGQLNPAYASTMSNLQSLMQNQNPNALSGSEQAQISRGLNQTNFMQGNQNVQNPLTTINNALTFGTGLQQKQSNFANLAGSAANTANTLNAGQNAFGLATGQPSGTGSPNTSTSSSQFLTSPNNTFGIGGTSSALGQGFLNQIGSTYNAANNASAGQVNSGSQSGQLCCFAFIFGRAYIPDYVRSMRDLAYQQDSYLHDGYSIVANLLCRLMWIPIIYWLVKHYMVKPLTEHCGYLAKINGCMARTNYQKVWFAIFHYTGKLKRKHI